MQSGPLDLARQRPVTLQYTTNSPAVRVNSLGVRSKALAVGINSPGVRAKSLILAACPLPRTGESLAVAPNRQSLAAKSHDRTYCLLVVRVDSFIGPIRSCMRAQSRLVSRASAWSARGTAQAVPTKRLLVLMLLSAGPGSSGVVTIKELPATVSRASCVCEERLASAKERLATTNQLVITTSLLAYPDYSLRVKGRTTDPSSNSFAVTARLQIEPARKLASATSLLSVRANVLPRAHHPRFRASNAVVRATDPLLCSTRSLVGAAGSHPEPARVLSSPDHSRAVSTSSFAETACAYPRCLPRSPRAAWLLGAGTGQVEATGD